MSVSLACLVAALVASIACVFTGDLAGGGAWMAVSLLWLDRYEAGQ